MTSNDIRCRLPIPGLAAVLAAGVAVSCSSGEAPSAAEPPAPVIRIEFAPKSVDIGTGRTADVAVRNAGEAAVGPVQLVAGSVRGAGGSMVPGAALGVAPQEIPTLSPGGQASVTLSLDMPAEAGAGEYEVSLEARVQGSTIATLGVGFSVSPPSGPVLGSLRVAGPVQLRQGDVEQYAVEATDTDGQPVSDPGVTWSVQPPGAGFVTGEGRFVGYVPGPVRVVAAAEELADTLTVDLSPRGSVTGDFSVAGRGSVTARYTSDHWEHGTAAYTGTWGCRESGQCGNSLYVWDISDPSAPLLTDSIQVDARVVNDVKVRATGDIAILTHESSADGLNGITLLDLADPPHPDVITRFTAPDLANGIHNVWIEGDYAYLVVDGAVESAGLRVVDITQPATPRIVASFYGGSSFLHDVYVRDGLAFLSHWWAGLIILDVGNGIAAGTPTAPREVGRIVLPGYRVHNAWYWPAAGYVFLGDEVRVPGMVRVIDVRDPGRPVEVASFTVPGAAPHNFWVDETREIAYFAWYEKGIQAVDVSGELLGQLESQGRRVASLQYGAGNFCFGGDGTCTWAPQLHDGHLFLSDLNTGLWVLRILF